jgi:hypothetical protein
VSVTGLDRAIVWRLPLVLVLGLMGCSSSSSPGPAGSSTSGTGGSAATPVTGGEQTTNVPDPNATPEPVAASEASGPGGTGAKASATGGSAGSAVPATGGAGGTTQVSGGSGAQPGGCADPSTLPESSLGLGYRQTNPPPEDPTGGGLPMIDATITLQSRQMLPGLPPSVVFGGTTDTSADATLTFTVDASVEVADLVGQTVRYQTHQELLSDCVLGSGPGTAPEPQVLAQISLRDAAGKLMVLNSKSTPTAADGALRLDAGFAPEITARWVEVDAGCQGLELTAVETGERVVATSAGRAELQLGGESFVVAVYRVIAPEAGSTCGAASWVLYRKDLLRPTSGS